MNGDTLKQYLAEYFSPPFFPPNVFSYANCLNFVDFDHFITQKSPDLAVHSISLKHPGGAFGYSFKNGSKKVVIALDNEVDLDEEGDLLGFCENADILLWDGMYTNEEITTKKGWGHSTVEQAIYFTKKSKVKKTVICHHSPTRSDEDIDTMTANMTGKNVEFAKEGTRFSL